MLCLMWTLNAADNWSPIPVLVLLMLFYYLLFITANLNVSWALLNTNRMGSSVNRKRAWGCVIFFFVLLFGFL